jgi:hypothetical protein
VNCDTALVADLLEAGRDGRGGGARGRRTRPAKPASRGRLRTAGRSPSRSSSSLAPGGRGPRPDPRDRGPPLEAPSPPTSSPAAPATPPTPSTASSSTRRPRLAGRSASRDAGGLRAPPGAGRRGSSPSIASPRSTASAPTASALSRRENAARRWTAAQRGGRSGLPRPVPVPATCLRPRDGPPPLPDPARIVYNDVMGDDRDPPSRTSRPPSLPPLGDRAGISPLFLGHPPRPRTCRAPSPTR